LLLRGPAGEPILVRVNLIAFRLDKLRVRPELSDERDGPCAC
jgi:hypothetical protein